MSEEIEGLDESTIEQEEALEAAAEAEAEEESKNTTTKTKPKLKSKAKFSLKDYKKNLDVKTIKYKPDSWIPMSEAFMQTSGLPGIPEGRLTMIYGHSDVGKSTAAIELMKNALEKGILPVLVNTEKKFNWEHANNSGVYEEDIIYIDSLESVEECCQFIKKTLDDQKKGDLATDIVIIWDSVGNIISSAELKADEKGDTGAIMATAKVLTQQIHRIIEKRISDTRKETHPYNATMLIINHAYSGPSMAPTLIPYGGKGIIKAATLVIRMGGIIASSTKCYATKDGVNAAFAIKSAFVVEKNHITNVAIKSKIVCTPHGFIMDDKKSIDAYKKEFKDDWQLTYDADWDSYEGK